MVPMLRLAVAVLLVAATAAAATVRPAPAGAPPVVLGAMDGIDLRDVTTTTQAPPPPPPPPPTTAAAPARRAARTRAPAVRAAPGGLQAYRGLGTWVDVYDWSRRYTKGNPQVGPADVDRMADAGVQTLYLQAGKWDAPEDVLEPDLLHPLLARAEARGLHLVVWYLPTLTDPAQDLRRLLAIAALPHVDGVAVDIESRDVRDVGERNRRLVELSLALRAALPGTPLAAIVLPPVVLEVVNPGYWPAFPYHRIAPAYDVWLTMGYWTERTARSGYRDAYRYTRENVDRLRRALGRADAAVHPIGGLGAGTSAGDVERYRQAAADTGALGGSLYDWRTTAPSLWAPLHPLRS